jgi:hypothetical protein
MAGVRLGLAEAGRRAANHQPAGLSWQAVARATDDLASGSVSGSASVDASVASELDAAATGHRAPGIRHPW